MPITGLQAQRIVGDYNSGELAEAEVGERISQAVERRKRRNQNTTNEMAISGGLRPDEISRIATNVLQWYARPPVTTDEEVADRLNEFFVRIVNIGEVGTFEKMCMALGVTVRQVNSWLRGTAGQTRAAMLERAKDILAAIDAELVITGRIPVVPYIYRSKNYYGMSDQPQQQPTSQSPFESGSPQEIAARYAAGMVDD